MTMIVARGSVLDAELAQALIQRAGIGRHGRRKLQEYRAEPVPELDHAFDQPRYRLLRIAQSPDMREVPAGLDRHDEAVRCARTPASKGLRRGQPIKCAIVLNCREDRGVMLQPPGSRATVGVERVAPVAVLPARSASDERHRMPASRSIPRGGAALARA